MKKPVCPFNYMEANLGLSRGDADCLLFKNTRDGMRELLDISRDEYRLLILTGSTCNENHSRQVD